LNTIKQCIAQIVSPMVRGYGEVDENAHFSDLGITSIHLMQLQTQIKKQLDIKIALKDILRNSSVAALAKTVEKAAAERSSNKSFGTTDLQKAYIVGRSSEVPLGGMSTRAYFEMKCSSYERDRFLAAVNGLLQAHPVLRTRFTESTQTVLEHCRASVDEHCYTGLSPEERGEGLESVRERLFNTDFCLDEPPLIRFEVSLISPTDALIHCVYDGIIADGWSQEVLIRDINRLYQGHRIKTDKSFEDYTLALGNLKNQRQHAPNEAYWRNKINSVPHAPSLPLQKRVDKVDDPSTTQIMRVLSIDEYKSIEKAARDHDLMVFALLFTLFGKALSRYSKNQRFFLNVPISARNEVCEGLDDHVGLYSDFIFLEFSWLENDTLGCCAARHQEDILDYRDHTSYPGTDVVKLFREQIGGDIPAPVVFTSTIALHDQDQNPDFIRNYIRTHTSQTWIEGLLTVCDGNILFTLNYVRELIPEFVAEGISDLFIQYLFSAAHDPSFFDEVNLPLLARDKAIIDSLNDTERALPMCSLPQSLYANMRAHPDQLAIAYSSGHITYGGLEQRVNTLLGSLKNQFGCLPFRVGLLIEKGYEQVVAAVACVCGNIAYMPIETEMPVAMIRANAQQAGLDIVLCDCTMHPKAKETGLPVFRLDSLTSNGRFEPVDPRPSSQPVVIINTSGTTGAQKSVPLEEAGIINCFLGTRDALGFEPGMRCIAVTNYCHDMSLFDSLGSLFLQGMVVVPNNKEWKDPRKIAHLMRRYNVEVWNSVPILFDMMFLQEESREACRHLKRVYLGGDWIGGALVKNALDICTEAKLYSVGGPTETTIWNIFHKITAADLDGGYVPYGRPFPNTSYHILNENGEVCPPGIEGTLCVVGVGVAQGYCGNSAETAVQFMRHNGYHAYNTGDLGNYLPDGTIKITGRCDFQTKINGKRVELFEIERAIRETIALSACAVLPTRGNTRISAFYVAESDLSEQEVRSRLEKRLLPYMIPSEWVRLAEMPLTRNGKIDRDTLAALCRDEMKVEMRDIPDSSGNTLESEILAKFVELTGNANIRLDDDFFAVGGDSIIAMKLAAYMNEHYKATIEVFDILMEPSISSWVRIICERSR